MITVELITALFSHVDEQLCGAAPKYPKVRLSRFMIHDCLRGREPTIAGGQVHWPAGPARLRSSISLA